MTDDLDLLRRVATRARAEDGSLAARVSETQIREAESRVGFVLHPLLAGLYREVADGGFGPDYQLLPLLGPGRNVVDEYLALRESSIAADGLKWPEGVLPILDWGCGMYAGVDCRSAEGQVLLFDPNPYDGDWAQTWFVDASGLSAWLATWISGNGWYCEDALDRDDVGEPQPWDDARRRLATT